MKNEGGEKMWSVRKNFEGSLDISGEWQVRDAMAEWTLFIDVSGLGTSSCELSKKWKVRT